MSADAIIVRDDVFSMIKAALAVGHSTAQIVWEGVEQGVPRDATWCRVSLRHSTGNQASLAGEDGVRRWNRTGFITVQCFAPLANNGVRVATEMASVVRDALQGKQSEHCVWFRNARIQEIGIDADWFNVNAIIDFDYDELR